MDSISLSTLVGLITQSAAGAAGKSAWETLAGLASRAFGGRQRADAALRKAKDGESGGALELAGYLVQAAAIDPDLARLLRTWISETESAKNAEIVINTISGSARITGHVVQARDIGSVHIGQEHRDEPA